MFHAKTLLSVSDGPGKDRDSAHIRGRASAVLHLPRPTGCREPAVHGSRRYFSGPSGRRLDDSLWSTIVGAISGIREDLPASRPTRRVRWPCGNIGRRGITHWPEACSDCFLRVCPRARSLDNPRQILRDESWAWLEVSNLCSGTPFRTCMHRVRRWK